LPLQKLVYTSILKLKGLVHKNKYKKNNNYPTIYSLSCHPRCIWLYYFS